MRWSQQRRSFLRLIPPPPVRDIVFRLHQSGYEAVLVGGVVRDIILKRSPKDWDIGTNAVPDIVEGLFPRTLAIGKAFGTITIQEEGMSIQITTFRLEAEYLDKRRPSHVVFSQSLEKDLARRDFTINAMAYDCREMKVVDLFGGFKDLKACRLKTVGDPKIRFKEDTLRVLRAGRFISELGFRAVSQVSLAARAVRLDIKSVSKERIRDEFEKLLLGDNVRKGLEWLDEVGVLEQFIPELVGCKGIKQGKWHQYDVFKHSLRSVEAAPKTLPVRLALLLHDIGKPLMRTRDRRGYHFYKHESKGAQMAQEILGRLLFPTRVIKDVVSLIQNHMFEATVVSENQAALRRLMRKVGEERIDDLIDVRRGDIIACGSKPHLSSCLKEIKRSVHEIRTKKHALSITDLAVDGHDIIRWLSVSQGPEVGAILDDLLKMVLEQPRMNTRHHLKEAVLKRKRQSMTR